VASGKRLHALGGNYSYVDAISFSPDGQIIAYGSGDAAVRLWPGCLEDLEWHAPAEFHEDQMA
jgi:WD40 repeat protein